MRKIKRNDEVVVITGKEKGKRGKIVRMLDAGQKVIIAGVNMVKKHTRPNPQRNQQGGIIEREAAIHISNIALVNPANNKASKVKITILEDGKKVRIFKSTGDAVEL